MMVAQDRVRSEVGAPPTDVKNSMSLLPIIIQEVMCHGSRAVPYTLTLHLGDISPRPSRRPPIGPVL